MRYKLLVPLLVLVAIVLVDGAAATHYKYDVAVSPAGPYHAGDSVTATTNTPTDVYPWINMIGYDPATGQPKISGDQAAFPGGNHYGDPFLLGPSQSYESGPLDVVFTVHHLKGGHEVIDARTTIHVDG